MSVELERYVQRRSGLLMPGRATPNERDYQGTYGEEAIEFLKIMQAAGFNILHDLPVNPPDEKFNCPYSADSAFALDMQRIDLEQLVELRDLTSLQLAAYRTEVFSENNGTGIRGVKRKLIREVAAHNFANDAKPERKSEFEAWRNKERGWLDSYAAYEVLKEIPGNAGKPWQQWEFGKDISPGLITALKVDKDKGEKFAAVCYEQWIAEQQATQYRDTAKLFGIELWGDVPFYTGPAEVWAHPELFNLDADGNQLSRGGVPEDGGKWQKWGNATYKVNVDDPESTNKVVDWWVKRLERALKISGGVIRLDYFIGLSGPYLLPMGEFEEAPRGVGIGRMIMKRLVGLHGNNLPFYAEDLGWMTDEALQIRDGYGRGINGSKVSVFGLEKLAREKFDENVHNPANYKLRTVAFTSNHDTQTIAQAIAAAKQKYDDRSDVWPYLHYIKLLREMFPKAGVREGMGSTELVPFEIARVIGSRALVSMIPVWDALGLGKEARYNIPNTTGPHNWTWRMSTEQMDYLRRQAGPLRQLNTFSGRTDYTLAS